MVSPMSANSALDKRAPATTRVVAAVLAVEGGTVQQAVDSVRSSVYDVERIAVIGGVAAEQTSRHDSLAALMETVDPSIDAVWIIHSDAIARPDALGALIAEMERSHASLVGSKIVDMTGTRLESVGAATDAFGEPYSGLDPDEVDLEQYDVVRDVAMVSGVSALVRRDLLRGLGGIDGELPPTAAGQDLSQRARLAGGRVMIVPSSEVRHAGGCRHGVASWRERAGRFRSMLKVYGIATLLWMIPVAMLLGLLDGAVRLFLRQPRVLFEHVMVLLWNIVRLPSTMAARLRIRAIRQVGDEELFRYQLPGSVLLRGLGEDLGARLGWVIDSEPGVITEEEIESESSRSTPAVITVVVLVLLLAGRGLIFGELPASRYSLALEPDWLAVLRSYAGSWNPAGLGSLDSLHPSIALSAVVQALFGGWTGVTAVISFAAMLGGVTGFGRLTGRLGLEGPSRYLAVVVLFLGPFATQIGASGDWVGLLALGALPWFVDLSIAKWPAGWLARVGRVGAIFVSASILASLAPLALAAAAAAVIAISLFARGVGTSSLLTMILAVDLGALAISPYLAGTTSEAFFSGGPTVDLAMGPFSGLALLVAAVVASTVGSRAAATVASSGLTMVVLATVGALFSLSGDVSGSVAALGALGAAMVVAAALSIDLERAAAIVSGLSFAMLSAVFVIVVAVLAVGPGRFGLPEDDWSGRLDFVESLSDDPESVRSLLIGTPESLPGDVRVGAGYAYRVVTAAEPTLAEARLPPMRIGDKALADVLAEIDLGDELRPGGLLAPFGIRWIVIMDQSSFADVLSAQLDLTEVPLTEGVRVFRNDEFEPRVVSTSGSWDASFAGASGAPNASVQVRLADNASVRFGPDWSQDGWSNVVSGIDGEIRYDPDPLRRGLSIAVAVMFAVATLAAVTLRRREPNP